MTFSRGKICHISYLVIDNFEISKDGGGDKGDGRRAKGKKKRGKGKGEKGNVTEKEKFEESRKSSYTHLRSLKTECTV